MSICLYHICIIYNIIFLSLSLSLSIYIYIYIQVGGLTGCFIRPVPLHPPSRPLLFLLLHPLALLVTQGFLQK